MPQGQADRTVLFTLKPVVDAAAESAFRQFESRFAQTYRNASSQAMTRQSAIGPSRAGGGSSAGSGPADLASIRRQAVSGYGDNVAATNRAVQASARQVQLEERMAADKERRTARERAVAERAARDEERRRQQAARSEERESEKAARATESARRKMVESNFRIAESAKTALGGITSIGRGLALMGIAGEENTKKLLEGFVKVEAAVSVVRGGIEVASSGSKIFRAARDSVAAASVAGKAAPWIAKAAVAGGSALGAVAPAGAVALGAGAMLWAGHRTFSAGDRLSGAAPEPWWARAAAGIGMLGTRAGNSPALGVFGGGTRNDYAELIESQKRTARMEEARRSRMDVYQKAQRMAEETRPLHQYQTLRFGMDLSASMDAAGQRVERSWGSGPMRRVGRVGEADETESEFSSRAAVWNLQKQRAQTQAQRMAAERAKIGAGTEFRRLAGQEGANPAALEEAGKRYEQSTRAVLDLREKEKSLVREIGEARKAGMREELQGVMAVKREIQAQREALRDRQRSQAIDFGMASPAERAQRLQIQRRARSENGLRGMTGEEIGIAQRDADPELQRKIEEEALRRQRVAFRGAGLNPESGWSGERAKLDRKESEAEEKFKKKYKVSAIGEVDVKLELDTRQVEDALESKFRTQRAEFLRLIDEIAQRTATDGMKATAIESQQAR